MSSFFTMALMRAHKFVIYIKGNVIRSVIESMPVYIPRISSCPTKLMSIEEELMPPFSEKKLL